MSYFNCPNCRLSIPAAASYAVDRDCPRCRGQEQRTVPMFVSARPHRMLTDELADSASPVPATPGVVR
jgi:hypothetical protein